MIVFVSVKDATYNVLSWSKQKVQKPALSYYRTPWLLCLCKAPWEYQIWRLRKYDIPAEMNDQCSLDRGSVRRNNNLPVDVYPEWSLGLHNWKHGGKHFLAHIASTSSLAHTITNTCYRVHFLQHVCIFRKEIVFTRVELATKAVSLSDDWACPW